MKRVLSLVLVLCGFVVLVETAQAQDWGRRRVSGPSYYRVPVGYYWNGRVYAVPVQMAPSSESESFYFSPSETDSRDVAPAQGGMVLPEGSYFIPLRRVPAFDDYQPNDNWN